MANNLWEPEDSSNMPPPREGLFDEQLSLFGAPTLRITSVVKRDGRLEAFDKSKIASAIRRAAASVKEEDRLQAESVAAGVAIYLAKQSGGEPPTVEQIDDAVERVLIELGYGETALAYARYRDKRTRIREIRNGNLQMVLQELREARDFSSRDPGEAPHEPLFVRTSDESLDGWDTGKIVDALVRETGIDAERAHLIALEVEAQLRTARVRTLTSSLIREMVDARLVEHGLEEFRRRHSRLGVPLYDAERILCFPNRQESMESRTPATTDLVLAERVKREFALTQVFPGDVADAHLQGDLYIHDLGYVDRLLHCEPDTAVLQHVKRADGVLREATHLAGELAAHFSGTVRWPAVNFKLALWAQAVGDASLAALTPLLVAALTPRHPLRARERTVAELELCEEPPGTGEDGHALVAEAPYARTLALHVLSTVAEQAFLEEDAPGLRVWLRLSPVNVERTVSRDYQEDLLSRASEMIARGIPLGVAFEQGHAPRYEAENKFLLEHVSVGQVSLNLPRLVYRVQSETPGDTEKLFAGLEKLVSLAAAALVTKRDFIERLLANRSFGPLRFLDNSWRGRETFDLEQADFLVGLTGLNECVQAWTGEQLHESEAALEWGERILSAVKKACSEHSRKTGIRLVPVAVDELDVALRMAGQDFRMFPDAAHPVFKNDPVTRDLLYTPGISLAADAALTPMERVRLEGRLHAVLPQGGVTRIRGFSGEFSAASIRDFIRKMCLYTRGGRVIFER